MQKTAEADLLFDLPVDNGRLMSALTIMIPRLKHLDRFLEIRFKHTLAEYYSSLSCVTCRISRDRIISSVSKPYHEKALLSLRDYARTTRNSHHMIVANKPAKI